MPQNKKEVINDRLEKVSKLYVQGYQQIEIANICGVTQAQISYDLKTLLERWKENQLANTGEWVSAELVKINAMEVQGWEQWNKSIEINILGDDKYMKIVQWCVGKRCDLLGLIVQKSDLTTNGKDIMQPQIVVSKPENIQHVEKFLNKE